MNPLRLTALACLMLALSSIDAAGQKLAPPDPALANRGKMAVRDVFGGEIDAAKTVAAKKAIAVKLLAVANDAKESGENRWALYLQARELALAAGDAGVVAQAMDDMAKAFDINHLEGIGESVDRLAKLATPASAKQIIDLTQSSADQASRIDDYRLAVRLLTTGSRLAHYYLKDQVATRKLLDAKLKLATEMMKAFDAAKATGAQSDLGRFYCLRKNDWAKGLPLLQLSSDESIAELARKEIEKPKDQKEQIALSTAWIEAAEKNKNSDRIGMYRRSLYWHGLAAEGVVGLNKAKLDQQAAKAIAEIDEADAQDGLFSLYAGAWTAKYANGHFRDFRVDIIGQFWSENSEKLVGNLTRTKGEVHNHCSGPRPQQFNNHIERFRYSGGTILIDLFWTPPDYPKKAYTTGVARPRT